MVGNWRLRMLEGVGWVAISRDGSSVDKFLVILKII